LATVIASKKKGRAHISKTAAEPRETGNVINIMDAVHKSILTETGSPRRH
jgi:non-homologous end joining protein Ku